MKALLRNQLCTLGDLATGDVFYFAHSQVRMPCRVTSTNGNGKPVEYLKKSALKNRYTAMPYKAVVFLRHEN